MEGEQKTILIVDDNNDLSTVLVDKFTSEGFNAVSAANGKEGLEKALEMHPDIMLLDVMMPEMDGWEALEALRKDEWGKDARVIMLTNLGDMENISQGVEKGTAHYMVKTDWDLNEVVDKVKKVLG